MAQNRKYGKVLYSNEKIVQTCKDLAKKLNRDYKNSELVTIVGILKGAMPFMAELIKHIDFDVRVDFMTATSYKDNKQSGELKMVMDLSHSVKNHDIIIIEDICESGLTLTKIIDHIKTKSPKSVKTAVLLNKQAGRKVDYNPDYIGIEHSGPFVVGFGFDDDGYSRNLPDIVEAK